VPPAATEARSSILVATFFVAAQLSSSVAAPAYRHRPSWERPPTEPPTSARHLDAVEAATAEVRALWQAFADLSSLQVGWDGEDAEVPNGAACETMHSVLEHLVDAGLVPERLNADVDGGLSAYFFHAGRGHVSIHCDNEGAVVLVDDDPMSAVRALEIDAQSPDVIESFVRARAEARIAG